MRFLILSILLAACADPRSDLQVQQDACTIKGGKPIVTIDRHGQVVDCIKNP